MADHYSTLGVGPTASHDEIKKAFRALSLQHHPDKLNGNAERFKEINEAYQIVGDEEKRQIYDAERNNPFMRNGPGDLFNMFFGGRAQGMGMPGMFGMQGGPQVHFFRNGVPVSVGQMRRPVPIVKSIGITLAQAYTGVTCPVEIERWVQDEDGRKYETEKVYVTVHPGADDGEIIILRGKGNALDENNKGHVKIFVKVSNNSELTRNGLDLVVHRELTLKEALIGFSFEIKHLSGKTYTMNNTSGKIINDGYEKRVPDMGMRRVQPHPAPVMIGDLVIRFRVRLPTSLTDKQRTALKDIL